MKHLGWVLGGWVGAGGQPRWQLRGPSIPAIMFWSVASTSRADSCHCTAHGQGQANGAAQEGQTHNWKELGCGRARELGLEHFLEAFCAPFEIRLITGTMTFLFSEVSQKWSKFRPQPFSLSLVCFQPGCCERSHGSPAQKFRLLCL